MLKRTLQSLGQMMYQQTRDIRVMNYEKFIVYDIPRNGDSLFVIQDKISGKLECQPQSITKKSLILSRDYPIAQTKSDFLN